MKIHQIEPKKSAALLKKVQQSLKDQGIDVPIHVGAEYTLSGMLEVIRRAKEKVVLITRCHPKLVQALHLVAQAPERYDLQPGYELHVAQSCAKPKTQPEGS
jgi:DNA-binding transcriptional LysR family regulator